MPAKKPTSPVEEDEDDKKKVLGPAEQAELYMRANKKELLNYEETVDYTISTGSLKLDIMTGQIGPGLVRLVGVNSGGKTSEGLELMRNFFLERPKGRAVFFKAEGRLRPEIRDRSGVKFVYKPLDWVEGTCLVYEGNVYDSIADFIMSLILNNPTKCTYFFMVDSLDGLILRDDVDKKLKDAHKVAGPAVIGKKLMQKCFGPLVKFGHIMVCTSQITAQPKIDPYAKVEHRAFSGSGGNWALHYPDHIWEFLPRFKGDKILKNPKAEYDQATNPIIGHLAKIIIRKSTNEKNDVHINYPIRYGRKDGTSIWVEREVGDIIAVYHVDIKSSWFTFKPDFYAELQAVDSDVPLKLQGIDQLYKFLENNPAITKYCFDKFRKLLQQDQVWEGEGDPLEEEEEETI